MLAAETSQRHGCPASTHPSCWKDHKPAFSSSNMQMKESAGEMDMDRWNSVMLLPCSTAFESGVLLQVQPPLVAPLKIRTPGVPPVERTLPSGGSGDASTLIVLPGTTRKGR